MGLDKLAYLPFKKISQNGVIKYLCELGQKRIIVTDPAILNGGVVNHVDWLSGNKTIYDHSLKLPAKFKLVAINAVDYSLVANALTILQVAIQTASTQSSVGDIKYIVSDPRIISPIKDIFQFKYRILSTGVLCDLEGIIFNDTFTTIPTYYKAVVTSEFITKYGTSTESRNVEYGTDTSASPYDSFSADSLNKMLELTIKLGDRCYRTDLATSYINITGNNESLSDWEVFGSSDGTGGVSLSIVQAEINSSIQPIVSHVTTISGNPHQVTKADVGLGNVLNIDLSTAVGLNSSARHNHDNKSTLDLTTAPFTIDHANAISANTLKIGITAQQSAAIAINSSKVGITQQQADAIVANTDKVGITQQQADAIVANTAKIGITPEQADAIVANTAKVGITQQQADAIVANTAKVGITPEQADAIVANSSKVGITTQQSSDITAANAHRTIITGNPHHVTKAEVGLGNVPNTDFTTAVAANTAKVGITPEQAAAIITSVNHSDSTSGNPHHVTKADIGLGNVPDIDFTNLVNLANTHRQKIDGNPHQVTKADVGLSNVPDIDFTSEISNNTAHTNIVSGNPHQVTKAEVGLGNVPNVDTTNASNITTGTLPSSVLPALAITDTFVVATEVAQLALTVQKGDIAVRTDEHKSYINYTGNNAAMTDWQELLTLVNSVFTVNGQTGIVILSTSNIAEGTNLYYTDERVSANANVALNTINRHNHTNKAILDNVTASFTSEQAADIITNNNKIGITLAQIDIINTANTHIATVTGNPHHVTKAEVGLGNVPNTDFTTAVAANTAKVGITTQQAADIVDANSHRAIIAGNPHQVTKSDVGLSNVPNTDFTTLVNNASNHITIVSGNPHHVTKTEVGLGLVPNHDFTSEVNENTAHRAVVSGNPHQVTKTEVGLGLVPNHDFTAEVDANTAKVGITPEQAVSIINSEAHSVLIFGNPHHVTKADVGLGNVPNTDFTTDIAVNNAKVGITVQQAADITSANDHRTIVAGNPHQVTKTDIGLSNVPNIDCTNASNITTGTLPSSVLPALAITDTFVVATETAQLALTVQKGDVAVRTDLKKSYVNRTGNNTTIADWQELLTPTDTILTVNGQTGVVILSTSNIAEGTNLYYTEARVSANIDVAANTANRHNHANKAILDATTAAFTISDADLLNNVDAHANIISGNPHQVTKAEIGLGNVPNTNFTTEMNINNAKVGITPEQAAAILANTAHRNTTSGNPHDVTKADVGLGNVPNHDFTAEVDANTAKVGITPEQIADITAANNHRNTSSGNPHQVTKADVGLGDVPNHDFTAEVAENTTHKNTVSGNPHQVTKTDVGLGSVPNHDFTAEVAANTAKVGITPEQANAIVTNTAKVGITPEQANAIVANTNHATTVSGNPHHVTKADVGLGNVPNIDCTNASNITTGTLPSSVLPALSLIDTFVVSSEIEQLALTVQKGDIAVRTDEHKSYINYTGNNIAITDWQELMTPTDTILTVNGQTGTVVLTTSHVSEGTNLYYTEARVSANANVALNTANRHSHVNKAILDDIEEAFTLELKSNIITNNTKVGITPEQAAAIVANTAKVGITTQQAVDITAANAHITTVSGNPHNVTKTEVGLGEVPNHDFTTEVDANTAHRGIIGNPHHVTKADVGLGNVPNTDFTTLVNNADAHIATVSGNPHNVTKTDVGLGNVPNHDFTAEVNTNTAKVGITVQQASDITAANAHRSIVSGNPHAVTKTDVGLGNVPNINCTNASNITTGTLPSSVLPALAISDTFVVATEAAQLALTVQKGDVAVRTDISRSFVNKTGNNDAITDWQELMTPADTILTVNGQTGTVVLTTTNIAEGTNLYYTEARVSANANVAANTAARHTHANKTTLDAITAAFTTTKDTSLTSVINHAAAVTGNPHHVTKTDVGLSNVPNTDFTSNVTAAVDHIATVVGNPHQVTKTEVGLGLVPNHDFTAEVNANTAKVGITPEQAAAIVANTAKVGITSEQISTINQANSHINITSGNPHNVTKAEVGLGNVPNHDFTTEMNINNAKVGITSQQAFDITEANSHRAVISGNPHQVTKVDVGLGNVPNTDFTTLVNNANNHITIVSGNPHHVTKTDVGLGNVPNIDCTNASNITTGTLPSSVLPALAISDTFVVATEAAQLALTVQKGDIAVRTDLKKSYINYTGNNIAITDWQELMTPTDTILTVNGQTGTVILTTSNIAEGTNLYYTEARVSANANVAANTAARHTHANKVILDTTTAAFTSEQAAAIVVNTAKVGIAPEQAAAILANTSHRNTTSGNPHAVTKSDVGLGNVPNTDFTTNVATAISHIATVVGNPHNVTKAEVGLGNVPNTDFTTNVATAISHIATVVGNPHNVTKAEVGLGNVQNIDLSSDVAANTTARHTHANKPALDLVSGINTGDQINITGNAETATRLAATKTINGVPFDGSANITIATGDVTTTGTQTLINKTLEAVVLNKGVTEQVRVMADNVISSANGGILTKVLSANTVFTDSLAAGQSCVMILTNGNSHTVTWPAITWVSYDGNVAPLIYANNVFVFWKIGTTLYGTFRGSF